MITLIAAFLIMSLLAYFNSGDSSGLKMIAQILGVVFVLYCISIVVNITSEILSSINSVQSVIILLIFLGVIIALVVFNRIAEKKVKKEQKNKGQDNTSNHLENNSYKNNIESYKKPLYIKNTEFKNELNTITRSKNEVDNEILKRKQTEIEKQAKIDYVNIKDTIKKCAENGQYKLDKDNNLKIITIDVYSKHLQKFKSGKEPQYITTTGGFKKQCVTYFINDIQMYDYYLKMLRNLTDNDGIIINVILKDNRNGMSYTKIPCIVCDTIVYPQNYSLYLRCSIKY